MAHIFDDFPVARKAVEYQCRGVAADARSSMLITDEELRHPVVRDLFARRRNTRPRNQRKADGVAPFENQQRVRLIVGKPVREDLVLVGISRAKNRKQTGVEVGQGFNIFAVNALDPLAILLRTSYIANTDQRNRILST